LPPQNEPTASPNTTVTVDVVKMVELPGCTCPEKIDFESNCWTNNLLSILFLMVVLASLICVPFFTIMISSRRGEKY
jgi:hypothetical protein